MSHHDPFVNTAINTYKLAHHLAHNIGATHPTMFVAGVRVGLATALWRPGLGHEYMGELKDHMLYVAQSNLYKVPDLNMRSLADFERLCIETIFEQPMSDLPTILEAQ